MSVLLFIREMQIKTTEAFPHMVQNAHCPKYDEILGKRETS